jgi:tetratricopeptide (TPR) repeat protein
MEHWAYYYNEGIASKEARNFEYSASCHLKVLEMEPGLEMPEAWHNAGAALLRLGKRAEAEPYLKRAIELYEQLIIAILEVDQLQQEEESGHYLSDDDGDEEDENWNEYRKKMDWFSEDENDLEIDNSYLFGEESVAYYLFWKSCCYALMQQKERTLTTLAESIREDDWFAIEAMSEEDLSEYRDDPGFRKIVEPALERIKSPEHRHLFEIFERIEKKILIGFEDPAEFVDDIIDEVEAEDWPDKTPVTWIRKTTRDLHKKQQERSTEWKQPTDVIRLATVFNNLCKKGILALHNTGFTQLEAIDEVTAVMNDMVLSPEQIRGFCFYSGENVEELIYKEKGTLYITFNNILLDDPESGIAVGQTIVDQLREQGFMVSWDGTMKTRIEIPDFSWKKVFISDGDQQQWDHWRVFDLF